MDQEQAEKRAEAWRKAADSLVEYNAAKEAWDHTTLEQLNRETAEGASFYWMVPKAAPHAHGQKVLIVVMERAIKRDFEELVGEALELLRAEALEAQRAAEHS